MLWIDFKELQTDRVQVLQRVLRFLGLDVSSDASAVKQRVDQALTRIPIHDGSRVNLPAGESAQKVEKLMAAARQRFG
jgi:hypothetical protein